MNDLNLEYVIKRIKKNQNQKSKILILSFILFKFFQVLRISLNFIGFFNNINNFQQYFYLVIMHPVQINPS